MSELTRERLKEILHYEPGTGDFTRKPISVAHTQQLIPAGCIDGYVKIGVAGRIYLAHRLVWFYMEGYFPKNISIDHIDRDKLNNKWANLRLASQQCNIRNTGDRIDNTSGVKGVYWVKRVKKWRAGIILNGVYKSLGSYFNYSNAVCARLAGEQCLSWGGCDNSSPAYLYVQKMLNG